jgi:hypothetical protein
MPVVAVLRVQLGQPMPESVVAVLRVKPVPELMVAVLRVPLAQALLRLRQGPMRPHFTSPPISSPSRNRCTA